MTRDVFGVDAESKVEKVRAELQERHIRHVPVVSGGKIVGVLSLRDILRADRKACADEKRALESYLLGGAEPPSGV